MGLEEELSDAREWVARNLMLDQVGRHHPTPLSGGLCKKTGAKVCVYIPPVGMLSACCTVTKPLLLSIQLAFELGDDVPTKHPHCGHTDAMSM